MTHYTFTQLPPDLQLAWVLSEGTYLTRRWQAGSMVDLYHLTDSRRGFFVEVGYDADQHRTTILSSFSSSEPLADYARGVQLSELL